MRFPFEFKSCGALENGVEVIMHVLILFKKKNKQNFETDILQKPVLFKNMTCSVYKFMR